MVIIRGAVVCTDVALANRVVVNGGAMIKHGCVIDEAAHTAPDCELGGSIVVEP